MFLLPTQSGRLTARKRPICADAAALASCFDFQRPDDLRRRGNQNQMKAGRADSRQRWRHEEVSANQRDLGTSCGRGNPHAVGRQRTGHAHDHLPDVPCTTWSRAEIIAEVAEESQEFGEWVGVSEVADDTIAQYRAQAQHFARVFEYEASFPLLLETRRLRDRVINRLRGHQHVDQARELYLLAAQVCGLLAWQTGDIGYYRAADTNAWTAWMCAEQIGHDGARAWVRVTQAKLAYWDGRYSESALLANDGLRYQSPDSARVFLALFRARALARIGQPEDARQALAHADAERAGVSAPDLLGGVWELTPGRYHGLAASTRLLLDEPERAVSEAAEALALSATAVAGERHLYAELLVRTDQATAYLRQPDLDAAAEALRPVLELTADMRTEPLLQQLRGLRHMLAVPPFAEAPVARGLQEEIETYDRDALPRQITP